MRGRLLSLALLSCLLIPASADAGFVLSIGPSSTASVGGSFTRAVIATWDGGGANQLSIGGQDPLNITTDSAFIENLVLNLDTSLTVYDATGGAQIGEISFDTLAGTNSDTEVFEIGFDGFEIVGGFPSPFSFSQGGLSITAIPEPTSAALLSIALMGLTRFRRRTA